MAQRPAEHPRLRNKCGLQATARRAQLFSRPILRAHRTLGPHAELDDGLDVVRPALERLRPTIERNSASDQAFKPLAVGASERFGGVAEVAVVGVDRPEYDVVLQN